MRALILIAGALALAACGKNDQAGNSSNVDESLTADSIVSNDVTAIDAVTGDAANMAADVEINDVAAAPLTDENGVAAPSGKSAKPATAASKRPATSKPAASSAPTATPSNAATNGTE